MDLPSIIPAGGLFGPTEEAALVSLLIDHPELMISLSDLITPAMFNRIDAKYVVDSIRQDFQATGVVPSRGLLRDRLSKTLTANDPYKEILSLVDRPNDPRETPFIQNSLYRWAEHQTYSLLYSDEAIIAHQTQNYEYLREIFAKVDRIKNAGKSGFWLYEQVDEIFIPETSEHISTGFPSLDKILNNGGPSKCEVLVWLAPTGVGKSLLLCNNAYVSSMAGLNVLLVTFELSASKTAARIISNMCNTPIGELDMSNYETMDDATKIRRQDVKDTVLSKVTSIKDRGDIVIYDLPPQECSVDQIYSIIDNLKKTRGWTPDVVILDYLELMMSRQSSMNDSDYTRQKSVATEIRGLAKNENVLVMTATQTNRSGMNGREAGGRDGEQDASLPTIGLEKSAESYGKNMAVDYVVSLNQTEEEYNAGVRNGKASVIRLFVAKNRNGQKFVTVHTNIWYNRMQIKEVVI